MASLTYSKVTECQVFQEGTFKFRSLGAHSVFRYGAVETSVS